MTSGYYLGLCIGVAYLVGVLAGCALGAGLPARHGEQPKRKRH